MRVVCNKRYDEAEGVFEHVATNGCARCVKVWYSVYVVGMVCPCLPAVFLIHLISHDVSCIMTWHSYGST